MLLGFSGDPAAVHSRGGLESKLGVTQLEIMEQFRITFINYLLTLEGPEMTLTLLYQC